METTQQLCQLAAAATLLVALFAAIMGADAHAAMLSANAMTMFTGAARIDPRRRR
jgi:hypothetical protein